MGLIVMEHKESDGVAEATREAFDARWSEKGWTEVTGEKALAEARVRLKERDREASRGLSIDDPAASPELTARKRQAAKAAEGGS